MSKTFLQAYHVIREAHRDKFMRKFMVCRWFRHFKDGHQSPWKRRAVVVSSEECSFQKSLMSRGPSTETFITVYKQLTTINTPIFGNLETACSSSSVSLGAGVSD
jgi:hypothetical protein